MRGDRAGGEVNKPVHVEARAVCGDGGQWYGPVFCDENRDATMADVGVSEWHAEPHEIQRATCPDCLLRIFMLGDSARIAVERMGMKIEAHDAPAEVEAS